MIAARHPQEAENKLRAESQVEPDEKDDRRHPRKKFRIELSRDFWPPIVQAAEVAHDRSADHDVVEVGDDEIRVVNVDIQPKAGQKEAGQSSDDKKANESQTIEHWCVIRNGASIQCSRPVKDFDSRRNGH